MFLSLLPDRFHPVKSLSKQTAYNRTLKIGYILVVKQLTEIRKTNKK